MSLDEPGGQHQLVLEAKGVRMLHHSAHQLVLAAPEFSQIRQDV